MNECIGCKSKAKDKTGICRKRTGSDGLPVLCCGPWVENKHYYLNRYCYIFSNGMKNKWTKRYYVDLFSGPGLCINWASGKEVQGSPLVAMSHNFTNFIFAESNEESLGALKSRVEKLAEGRQVSYCSYDVNEAIKEIYDKIKNEKALFLAFVDPFHIHIKMKTLQMLSMDKRVDFLLHFPWGTYLQRVLRTSLKNSTIEKIDDYFGDNEWQKIRNQGVYKVDSYLHHYQSNLRKLGYLVDNNYPKMKNTKESTLYYLVLASKDKLGLKFWQETCKIEADGQRKLFYE